MYNYRVYNNLQSMYNTVIGRAASFVSSFYFILLDSNIFNAFSPSFLCKFVDEYLTIPVLQEVERAIQFYKMRVNFFYNAKDYND